MMHPAFALARGYGLTVELADLGDWGAFDLRSEYDPQDAVIRINARVVKALHPHEVDGFIAFAIAHELYHHRERCGEIVRLPIRAQREAAADAFARGLLR